MATAGQPQGGQQAEQGQQPEETPGPLALPAPGGAGGVEQPAAEGELRLGGGGVALDHLGPVVVNADGSLSRIANWAVLSERERDVAARRISKRNQERLAALRAAEAAAEAEAEGRPG